MRVCRCEGVCAGVSMCGCVGVRVCMYVCDDKNQIQRPVLTYMQNTW